MHGPYTYVLLAHRNPDAVLRLANTILKDVPDSRVLVHYSALSGQFPETNDTRIIAVRDPAAVKWATFSQTDMMLRSIQEIRQAGLPDEWVVFLSGQCYPVRPLSEFENMLATSEADAALSFKRVESADHNLNDRYRFSYRVVRDGPLPFPLNIRSVRGVVNRIQPMVRVKSMPRISFIGTRRRTSIFDLSTEVYFGSCWFALARTSLRYIDLVIEETPAFLDAYRDTISAEESFFSTILASAPGLRVRNMDLHYVDWSSVRTGSPRALDLRDFPEIKRSGKWFVRKIDLNEDGGLRDALDENRWTVRQRDDQAPGPTEPVAGGA